MEMFVDGVNNIVEAQQRMARAFFEDGSIEECCPPLRALLARMAGNGQDADEPLTDAEFRELFTRENLLESDWYRNRLLTKQSRDVALWERHVAYLKKFLARASHRDVAAEMEITARLRKAENYLKEISSAQYIEKLRGTIGADPLGAIASDRVYGRRDLAEAVR